MKTEIKWKITAIVFICLLAVVCVLSAFFIDWKGLADPNRNGEQGLSMWTKEAPLKR